MTREGRATVGIAAHCIRVERPGGELHATDATPLEAADRPKWGLLMHRTGLRVHASLAILLTAAGSVSALAAPGDLDPTFGGTGKVSTFVGDSWGEGWSVAAQPDGKVVVAGFADTGDDNDFAVARFNDDGTLDPSFGGTGWVTTAIGTSDDRALDVAVQPDGRIVVAGYGESDSGAEFAVVRYDVDGSLDQSFGGTGRVTTPVGVFSIAWSIGVQADGKIVAAGFADYGNRTWFAVVRYDSDGSLDPTFGGTGKVTTPILGYDFAFSLALQANGKIVVGGYALNGVHGGVYDYDFAVVRYDGNGTLDSTFGGTGKVVTPIGPASDRIWSVAVQEDGKIVAAGFGGYEYADGFLVVRYDQNGALDPSFGDAGKVVTSVGESGYGASSVAIQGDGKIIVAGTAEVARGFDFGVVRYNVDGTLDPTFGSAGKVTTPIGNWDFAHSVALRTDGKIVVAGSSSGAFSVVRYEGGPTCGNGLPEETEACDDGNNASGDCCSSTCQYELLGSPCADGDLCDGDETCDGAGACRPGSPLDCDDGDACTQDSCDPSAGCLNAAAPATTCLDEWGKASLQVDERRPGRERLTVKLGKGPGLDPADFGDPVTPGGTAYTTCIYDHADTLVGRLEIDRGGATCGAKPCWRPTASGFLYKDTWASAHGVSQIKLKGGNPGRSQIALKGENDLARGRLELPLGLSSALFGSSRATVQVHGSDAPACFSRTFEDVERSEPNLFEAKESTSTR